MNDILCSICIPSRKRPEGLRLCIEQIAACTSKPDRVEFIVRADEDDIETISFLDDTFEIHGCLIEPIIGPRLQCDYADMVSNLLMECIAVARGRWIWIMNDDAGVMPQSRGWDEKLAHVEPYRTLVSPEVNLWEGKVMNWPGFICGAWHTCHFPIMLNGWWKEYGFTRLEPPADKFTLNFLTGLGHEGTPPGAGWRLVTLNNLVTWHGQKKDELFNEHKRVNFE